MSFLFLNLHIPFLSLFICIQIFTSWNITFYILLLLIAKVLPPYCYSLKGKMVLSSSQFKIYPRNNQHYTKPQNLSHFSGSNCFYYSGYLALLRDATRNNFMKSVTALTMFMYLICMPHVKKFLLRLNVSKNFLLPEEWGAKVETISVPYFCVDRTRYLIHTEHKHIE